MTSLASDQSCSDQRINVFVHLAASHDAREWNRRWKNKTLVGINDPSPYGYARANLMGCHVRFSSAQVESFASKYFRLAMRLILGFDLIHAWRNAKAILAADVVWTHTESQFLAVSALLKFAKPSPKKRPKIIGQAVWLLDRWKTLPGPHRMLYRQLIGEIDVLTVHSHENAKIARELFPNTRVEVVLFGIPNEKRMPVEIRPAHPIRVLSLGNDRHRDWDVAVSALAGRPDVELTIVSSTARPQISPDTRNVRILEVTDNLELQRLFEEATLMLVPLKPNKHASGITVLQEAALMGLPIIATDTGGLRAYFDDDAVVYLPPSDPAAIASAVTRVGRQPKLMEKLALAAQRRASSAELGCGAYVRRHVDLTKDLLQVGRRY